MATWGQLLAELQQSGGDYDGLRRRQLAGLQALTGRPTVLYASDWFTGAAGPVSSIGLQDMQGLMEVFQGLPGPALDLILHSPGGDASATASLVHYMRSKYDHVRVFVPVAAMSAATMWALAADEIVMGKHSQLGPIDPQLVTSTGSVPTGSILKGFERATEECRNDPGKLSAWLPTLQQYYPGLLEFCQDAEALARELVHDWLKQYMFRDRAEAEELATTCANFFADTELHKSHNRGIFRDEASSLGLTITELEEDQALQDAVLSVHHATIHTFTGTTCGKLIENHEGRAFIIQAPQKQQAQQAFPAFQPIPIQMPFPQQS